MIGQSKMNVRLHDMTPNRMMLVVSVFPPPQKKKKQKKIQQTSDFNQIVFHCTLVCIDPIALIGMQMLLLLNNQTNNRLWDWVAQSSNGEGMEEEITFPYLPSENVFDLYL